MYSCCLYWMFVNALGVLETNFSEALSVNAYLQQLQDLSSNQSSNWLLSGWQVISSVPIQVARKFSMNFTARSCCLLLSAYKWSFFLVCDVRTAGQIIGIRGSAELHSMEQARDLTWGVHGLAMSFFTDTTASELVRCTVYLILSCHCKLVKIFTLDSLR